MRQIVVGHLRQMAAGHSITTEPEARDAADLVVRVTALADRLAEEPALVGSLIASGTLTPDTIRLQLDPGAVASALDLSEDRLSDRLLQVS